MRTQPRFTAFYCSRFTIFFLSIFSARPERANLPAVFRHFAVRASSLSPFYKRLVEKTKIVFHGSSSSPQVRPSFSTLEDRKSLDGLWGRLRRGALAVYPNGRRRAYGAFPLYLLAESATIKVNGSERLLLLMNF